MAALFCILIYIVLLFINCIDSDVLLDIVNGETSPWTLMTCQSSYCSNSTIFTFNGEEQCHNPLLSVQFRLTDFLNSDTQYLTITLNQQRLGFCTGPNNATYHANYNISSIPLYTECLDRFSIAELVGYNPTAITLTLRISQQVTNTNRTYNGDLLYALVAFGCSDEESKKVTIQSWDPTSPVPANSNLQCIQSGCYGIAQFNVLKPEQCRVPLLSLQFWLTDFDKDYEYLTVEVNDQYLGICEGGKEMEINPNLVGIEEEDTYWNNYSYWCFKEIDISRYTGIEPEEIMIKLSIQETVDRNWLDASPTPYLLDAIVQIRCSNQTQDDMLQSPMIYDRKTTSPNYRYPHEISIKCQEVECGAMWDWHILGSCPYPILSLFYFTEHYDDSMVEIRINEEIFGHCGPTKDTGDNITVSVQYGMENVRTCFEKLEIIELLKDSWNTRPDFNGNPDAISNAFQFGIALTEIDKLDGITNGSVAHLFINLDCSTQTNIKNNELVTISDDVTNNNGYPIGSTEINCVYAGCSSKATFSLYVQFTECEIPRIDLFFWLTDFGLDTEFLSIAINGHLYGWCDGGKDHDFHKIYTCLYNADIQEWADWDTNGNELELRINASSHVDGLDANKDGFLFNGIVKLICEPQSEDRKITGADIYPNNDKLKTIIQPIECQGVGCWTYSFFYIRNNICYQPTLSVSFWLSDFQTFDEYADVLVNEQELDRCYGGGGDNDFGTIWSCFQYRDIRYILTNYPYNNHGNIDEYYINIDDVVNVSLKMSLQSVWLDHSKNNSVLEGTVTLSCKPNNIVVVINDNNDNNNNITIIPDRPIEDIGDSDNSTFRFIELTINIAKVPKDTMLAYHGEITSRFEYSLDATIHFQDENKANDRIAFTLRSEVDVVDSTQLNDLKIYIITFSHENAKEIKRIIELDIFLFILQETLRDSHFANSILESITNIKLTSSLPQTIAPTPSPSIGPTVINTEETNIPNIESRSNDNFLSVLFTSASATDWLSFIGVLILSVCVCVCCIAAIGLICVYQQKNKTRKEIQKYKQTKESSDTDIDEMQGMMNDYDDNQEHSIMSHESHSIRSHPASIINSIIGGSGNNKDEVAEKIRVVNRANNLKDNVKRHLSGSGLHAHHNKMNKKNNNKHKNISHRRSSYSHSSNQANSIHSAPLSIGNGIAGNNILSPQRIMSPNNDEIHSSSKSTAIHPALSTAIQTVNKMNGIKAEIAATHGLVVASTIIEADSEDDESPPSGIDLSEELLTIDDDDISIDIHDIDDMHDIQKKHKRKKSKNKKYKKNKYSSIKQIDDDDEEEEEEEDDDDEEEEDGSDNKVFGMRSLAEDKEQDRFSPAAAQKMKKSRSSDEDSDALSDLSAEQSLNSLTATSFSQML